MTALPSVAAATVASATEGDVKNFLTDQHGFLSGLFGSTGEKPATRVALQVPMHSKTDKSGAYTVIASDQGMVINCSGTWTLALTEAATLGDGFVVAVMNSGAGTITIDPAGVETIDGAATKTLGAGKLLLIYCNGASFASVGSVDSASIVAALGYTPANLANAATDHTHNYVSKDAGVQGVGMFAYAKCMDGGGKASGATIAGSNLQNPGTNTNYTTGTWRNVVPRTIAYLEVGMWQRIS